MDSRLTEIASKYVWWNPPEASLRDRKRLVAQVMQFGTWEDAHWLLRHLGKDAFLEVLNAPPPGVLSQKAWYFWHRRLLHQAPPTPFPPGRQIPHGAEEVSKSAPTGSPQR